jgi:predicted amidohydrolase
MSSCPKAIGTGRTQPGVWDFELDGFERMTVEHAGIVPCDGESTRRRAQTLVGHRQLMQRPIVKVACALTVEDLTCEDLQVLVLPEGVSTASLFEASARHPELIVVGATAEVDHMRAYVLVNGQNMVNYLKISSDGRSTGVGNPPESAVYLTDTLALGVLVCMDCQHDFRLQVRDALLASERPVKLICVPADMHCHWFSSQPVLGWPGIHVALSNGTLSYPLSRAQSMIAGPDGLWRVRQAAIEPIVVEIDAQSQAAAATNNLA